MKKTIIFATLFSSMLSHAGLVCQETRFAGDDPGVLVKTNHIPFVHGEASIDGKVGSAYYHVVANASTNEVRLVTIQGGPLRVASATNSLTGYIVPSDDPVYYQVTCTIAP